MARIEASVPIPSPLLAEPVAPKTPWQHIAAQAVRSEDPGCQRLHQLHAAGTAADQASMLPLKPRGLSSPRLPNRIISPTWKVQEWVSFARPTQQSTQQLSTPSAQPKRKRAKPSPVPDGPNKEKMGVAWDAMRAAIPQSTHTHLHDLVTRDRCAVANNILAKAKFHKTLRDFVMEHNIMESYNTYAAFQRVTGANKPWHLLVFKDEDEANSHSQRADELADPSNRDEGPLRQDSKTGPSPPLESTTPEPTNKRHIAQVDSAT